MTLKGHVEYNTAKPSDLLVKLLPPRGSTWSQRLSWGTPLFLAIMR